VAGNYVPEQGELFIEEPTATLPALPIDNEKKDPSFYRQFYNEEFIVTQYKEIIERAKRDPKALKDAVAATDRLASLLGMDVGGNSARNDNGTNINILTFDDIMRKKTVNAEITTKEVDYADARADAITADAAPAEPAEPAGPGDGGGFGCRSASEDNGDKGGKPWKPPF